MASSVRFYELGAPSGGHSREGWAGIMRDLSARPRKSLVAAVGAALRPRENEFALWTIFHGSEIRSFAAMRSDRAEAFEQAARSQYGPGAATPAEFEDLPLPEILRVRAVELERGDIFPLSDEAAFEELRDLAAKHPDETVVSAVSVAEAEAGWSSDRRVRALLADTSGLFAGLRATRWYSVARIALVPLVWFWRGFRFLFDPFPAATQAQALYIPEAVADKLSASVFSVSIALAAADDGRSGDSILADAAIARLANSKSAHANRPRLGKLESMPSERLARMGAGKTGHLAIEEIVRWLAPEKKRERASPDEKTTVAKPEPKQARGQVSDEQLAILSDATRITPIGTLETHGQSVGFGIPDEDRKRHVYMIGKTGTGKTTLLSNMLLSDIYAGRGVGLIDPHGDLSRDILARIPSHRTNDVVFFDASDAEFPSAFNLFAWVASELRGAVASGIVSIFKRLYGNSWGPRLEYILRNAVLSLLGTEEPTLLSITHLLTNAAYRARIVDKLDDPVLKNFWTREFDRMDRRQMTDATAPILNKIGQFLANPLLRNIVLQPKNAFSPRWIMDKGKILVVRIPKGTIGEDTMAFLGSLLVTRFQIDAMSRANLPPDKRREFRLYIDEFQNFASESFEGILSEGRKFGLSLVLGNQYVSQIPDEISRAVFGNVASVLAFQTGPMDAGILSKVMDLDARDASRLQALPRYHILAKLNLDGTPVPAFEGTTLPPPDDRYPAEPERAYAVERVSREKYAKPREFVEKKIRERIAAMDDRG